jgi:hypothetical protein
MLVGDGLNVIRQLMTADGAVLHQGRIVNGLLLKVNGIL